MLQNSFGIQLSYAPVFRRDGADPRPEARAVLRDLRVPAGLRDASAAWSDGSEALLSIPVTDDGHVLTLTDADTIATTLTSEAMRQAFEKAGLQLRLDEFDGFDEFDEFDAVEDGSAESDAETGSDDRDEPGGEHAPSAPEPVRVAAFSHRGPVAARYLAEYHRSTVTHVESGEWSVQRYSTSEAGGAWPSAKAELPVMELNRVDGGGDWIDVTAHGRAGATIPFWPDAERDTRPVLDLDLITVPETTEIYRRLLTEGDGSRDELLEVAGSVPVDVDAAHRALIPEALGGVAGVEQRQRAFLAAFGVPSELIDAGLGVDVLEARTFAPTGWASAARETIIGGMVDWAPLTRRNTPLQRFTRWLAARPLIGVALSVGEFAAGLWAARRLRGGWRGIGMLAVIDAIGDLIIWCVRIRRGR